MSTHIPWSEEEVERIRELFKDPERWTAGQMTSIMNKAFPGRFPKFTRNAILGKAHRLEWKMPREGQYSHNLPRPRPVKVNKGKFLGTINTGHIPRHKDKELQEVPERSRAYTIPKTFLPTNRTYTDTVRYERKGTCTWPLCDKEAHGSYCEDHKKIVYQPRGEPNVRRTR